MALCRRFVRQAGLGHAERADGTQIIKIIKSDLMVRSVGKKFVILQIITLLLLAMNPLVTNLTSY